MFLGLDQGSSSTKSLLIRSNGEIIHEHSIEVGSSVAGERAEQDGEELYQSVKSSIELAMAKCPSIVAIGLACQRSGVIAWEAPSGKTLHPLITHRDKRLTKEIEALGDKKKEVQELTGLPVLPQYAACKIAKLQKQFPKAAVGTLDTFIVNRLCGEKPLLTDDSMAARTMLYSLAERGWNKKLCNIFEVDLKRLAKINPSFKRYGTYKGIPLAASLGDQQAALLSQLWQKPCSVINLGTIASLTIPCGEKRRELKGFVPSVLYSDDNVGSSKFAYVLEGISPNSAKLVEDGILRLKVKRDLKEIQSLCDEGLKLSPEIAVFLAPQGSGTPGFHLNISALALNWREEPHAIRAIIENVGCFVVDMLKLVKDEGYLLPSIRVIGGVSNLDYLLQFIADASNTVLERAAGAHGTAFGAALAAIAATTGVKAASDSGSERVFHPADSGANLRYKRWCTLRERALSGDFTPNEVIKWEQKT